MANKHKTRNRIMIFFLSFLLLLALGIFLFLRQPLFGKAPSGARLERMKQSPNYKDGKFQNRHFTQRSKGFVIPRRLLGGFLIRIISGAGLQIINAPLLLTALGFQLVMGKRTSAPRDL